METLVRTPQLIFMHPQRLIVPLFQRPYVWNLESQWEPLWHDLARMAERLLESPAETHHPHFLGAVVLQQTQNSAGTMQERTIIDGQQRLTTMQLLFDALHAELSNAGAALSAARLEPLIRNADPYCSSSEDQFKVWPTNRDRPAFNAVMSAPLPVDYDEVGFKQERMTQAHRYFSETAASWLREDGDEGLSARAESLERAARDFLQLVVIELNTDENAQEIFETLNARGSQLTAADLIKNFVFQQLLESDANVEDAYEKYWRHFESSFWETELSVGRIRYIRSSIFLNHWLIAETGEDVVAREVFTRFKRFVIESSESMESILSRLTSAAQIYRNFVEVGTRLHGPIDRVGLFSYRTGAMESEVIKPLILVLLNPNQEPIPADQLQKALSSLESWMVRRMVLKATTKNYNQLIAELIRSIKTAERKTMGNFVEQFLLRQKSNSRYWPDDHEIKEHLKSSPVYRRLRRGRLRMVLEAIEDQLRGWMETQAGLGGERVTRGKLAIEHIMPQKWSANWPLDSATEDERDALIHTIGNLTLLTTRLNSKVSNGPWDGVAGKRKGLEGHDVLLLNRELLKTAGPSWTESQIRARGAELTKLLLSIWPAPEGYRSGFATEPSLPRHRIDLSDLLSADFLKSGTKLIPSRKKLKDEVAVVLPDGRIEWNGEFYASPSHAGRAMSGLKAVNGWHFFHVNDGKKRLLNEVRLEYLESISADFDEEQDAE